MPDLYPPVNTPIIDGRSGIVSREWLAFFRLLAGEAGDVTGGITALTGDVTGTGPGVTPTTIANGVVSNAKLAAMPESTIKGRAVAAGTGTPTDLTATQATAILNVFSSTLKGLAPASGGGTAAFLRADGTWTAPPGGGGWIPLVDGSEPPVFITDGAGVLLLVAGP